MKPWIDERDVPDGRYGKSKTPGCECTDHFTCGACLQRCVDRNAADRAAAPIPSDKGRADTADRALLAMFGEAGLEKKEFWGVIDRLKTSKLV